LILADAGAVLMMPDEADWHRRIRPPDLVMSQELLILLVKIF